jgi:O-methyltransferase involved in polyketide biosynthesis
VGIATRTVIIDRLLQKILDQYPDSVVVNLGAGLCTRSFRVPAGWSRWFDVDLPIAEPTWTRWIGATARRSFVAGSLAQPDWLSRVAVPGRHHVFIAEGSLMYVARDDVRALIDQLARGSPGADAIVETVGPLCLPLAVIQRPIARTGARFRWGVWSARVFEDWCPAVRCVHEYSLLDEHHARWGVLRHLARSERIRRQLNVAHLRFDGPAA